VLVEAQAKASFGQHTSKRGLAHLQRITPHVVAVQFDKVEGVEEYAPVSALVADQIEQISFTKVGIATEAVDNGVIPS
jgi:hypothetical protein